MKKIDAIRLEATEDSPEVVLDANSGEFRISGKSLPEDVVDFYAPVLDWLERYVDGPLDKTIFEFKLVYFNTASSKLILDILMLLEKIPENGKEVLVRWHSSSTDEEMQEAGEEYAELTDLDFEYFTFES